MEFKTLSIKNFRNFEKIDINISNRNLFIGLNDVGKTNLMYAIRFLFDRELRRNNLIESDYHKKNTHNPIEIVVKIDLSNDETDVQKLRAKLRGVILSEHSEVYIKLTAKFDNNEMIGIPELYWGGDLNNLYPMPSRGAFFEIDKVFNLIYIDSYVSLNTLFKKNANTLLQSESEQDKDIIKRIQKDVDELNRKISTLSGVQNFEEKVTPEFKKYRDEEINISIESEIAIKSLFSNVIPYIKENNDEKLYPTSGDGRQKLLVYAIYDLIAEKEKNKKINLFLIEEPENHLHKSMQIALSRRLFSELKFKHLFVSTHSPYILQEMDDINIVRIYNQNKIDSVSKFYEVPAEFHDNKKILNKQLSEAIFSDTVLLVEGPSEVALFEKVLYEINPNYETNGGYILPVNGINFENYYNILTKLNIKTILKTDNDLQKVQGRNEYSVIGFTRMNKFIKDEERILPERKVNDNTNAKKIKLYEENKTKLDKIRRKDKLFLSKIDLEHDLFEAIESHMEERLGTKDPVKYLQKSKLYNMTELVNTLDNEICREIYNHYNFACLREVLE